MENQKLTRIDLAIKEGKIDVKFIEVDGKKIIITPVPNSNIRNFITHENCNECGKEFKKNYTYDEFCDDCRKKKEEESYLKMDLVEWDGDSALYLYDSTDKYFFDYSDILDYCDEEDVELKDLKLVVCTKSSFSPIDLQNITEEVTHDDWEPSEEFMSKFNEFNEWLENQNTNTWFPGNKRVDIISYNTNK